MATTENGIVKWTDTEKVNGYSESFLKVTIN